MRHHCGETSIYTFPLTPPVMILSSGVIVTRGNGKSHRIGLVEEACPLTHDKVAVAVRAARDQIVVVHRMDHPRHPVSPFRSPIPFVPLVASRQMCLLGHQGLLKVQLRRMGGSTSSSAPQTHQSRSRPLPPVPPDRASSQRRQEPPVQAGLG
jgi:hypothetical protein